MFDTKAKHSNCINNKCSYSIESNLCNNSNCIIVDKRCYTTAILKARQLSVSNMAG